MTLEKFTKIVIKLFVIYVLVGLAVSCDISKAAVKSKTSTDQQNDVTKTGTIITEALRPGGTVKGSIIPEAQREKDENGFYKELIQKLTDGGATQTIYYKPDGTVDYDCTADEIWSRIEQRLEERDKSTTITETKDKASEKTEDFDSSVILYVMGGFALMVLIIAFFGFKLLNKNTQALTAVLQAVSK